MSRWSNLEGRASRGSRYGRRAAAALDAECRRATKGRRPRTLKPSRREATTVGEPPTPRRGCREHDAEPPGKYDGRRATPDQPPRHVLSRRMLTSATNRRHGALSPSAPTVFATSFTKRRVIVVSRQRDARASSLSLLFATFSPLDAAQRRHASRVSVVAACRCAMSRPPCACQHFVVDARWRQPTFCAEMVMPRGFRQLIASAAWFEQRCLREPRRHAIAAHGGHEDKARRQRTPQVADACLPLYTADVASDARHATSSLRHQLSYVTLFSAGLRCRRRYRYRWHREQRGQQPEGPPGKRYAVEPAEAVPSRRFTLYACRLPPFVCCLQGHAMPRVANTTVTPAERRHRRRRRRTSTPDEPPSRRTVTGAGKSLYVGVRHATLRVVERRPFHARQPPCPAHGYCFLATPEPPP